MRPDYYTLFALRVASRIPTYVVNTPFLLITAIMCTDVVTCDSLNFIQSEHSGLSSR